MFFVCLLLGFVCFVCACACFLILCLFFFGNFIVLLVFFFSLFCSFPMLPVMFVLREGKNMNEVGWVGRRQRIWEEFREGKEYTQNLVREHIV